MGAVEFLVVELVVAATRTRMLGDAEVVGGEVAIAAVEDEAPCRMSGGLLWI